VADDAPPVEFSGEDWDSAVRILFDALHEKAGLPYLSQAMVEFGFGPQPPESEIPLFLSYASHVLRDEAGLRFADRFLAAHGRELSPEQVASITALMGSRASLFRVERVNTGTGLEVHDLIEDTDLRISEVSLSSQLRRRDLVFGWIMRVGEGIRFTGGVLLVPPLYREAVEREVVRQLENHRRAGLSDQSADPVGEVAWCVPLALRDRDGRAEVELVNTDGEELLISTAVYDVSDIEAVRASLESVSGLRESEQGFDWLDQPGGESRLLGEISLGPDGLRLATNSRERLLRGKSILEDRLGELARHRIDTFSALGPVDEFDGDPIDVDRDDVDLDEEGAELSGSVLRAHYDTWPDVPLPALDGLTPREAAATPDGRDLVRDLLEDIEYGTYDLPGGETVDFGAIRYELGLDDDLLEDLTPYDASEPPDPEEWLDCDESLRMTLVEAHHHQLEEAHPVPENPRLHALIHVVVENQIAAGDPPESAATVRRLMAEGLTRHEAIHAVGTVIAAQLFDVMQGGKEIDHRQMIRELTNLSASGWLDSE
jgi:hypothetical protein